MTIIKEIKTMFPVQTWQIGQENRKFYLMSKGSLIAVSYRRSEIEQKLREMTGGMK